ncbi:hypothetical protein D3C76_1643480 [compost metagenome]
MRNLVRYPVGFNNRNVSLVLLVQGHCAWLHVFGCSGFDVVQRYLVLLFQRHHGRPEFGELNQQLRFAVGLGRDDIFRDVHHALGVRYRLHDQSANHEQYGNQQQHGD